MQSRPFPWERWYSAQTPWDTPLDVTTLPQLLDHTVERFSRRPVIEYFGYRLSYADFRARVDDLAARIATQGVGRNDAVAVYLPNTPHHPIAFFAIQRIGARVVQVSPLDAEREVAFKLADSGARMLLTTDATTLLEQADKAFDKGLLDSVLVAPQEEWGPPQLPVSPIPERFVSLGRLVPRAASWPPIEPDQIALLQYTGGTTGQPKAAVLTHANLTAAVSIYSAWYKSQGLLGPEPDRVICVLPLFHIYGLTSLFLRSFSHGSEILLRPRFNVETVLHDIEKLRATAFPGVPTMWQALLIHPGVEHRDFSSLRICSSGGAPLPVEIEERCARLIGRRLGGGWGMTETSPAGINIPRNGPVKPGTIGIPLPNVEVDVVALEDPTRVLPPHTVGELRIRGPNVMSGYWNRPEETAAAFADGRLLTGDVGYMDDDGYFFIVDRKKDMILSGGFNVYPQMIEQAVYEHPQVEEALVIGVPDPYRGEAAKLFVKLRAGAPGFTLDELRGFLSDKLGSHELPQYLELRDSLPRTAVGKLSKAALKEQEQRRRETESAGAGEKLRGAEGRG
jgi:long-chain acyl-CoA synthetase